MEDNRIIKKTPKPSTNHLWNRKDNFESWTKEEYTKHTKSSLALTNNEKKTSSTTKIEGNTRQKQVKVKNNLPTISTRTIL